MAGTVKVDNVQLGTSATPSQNFVLKTNADGTATLARGNLGATTQDILTVDSDGRVVLANVIAYADDAAAATAGLAIGGVYRVGNALQIRVA